MVSMAFPNIESNHNTTVNINVPLIAITPISSPQIKEVKIKSNLDIYADENGEISIAWANNKKQGIFDCKSQNNATNTEIEVTITGRESPEGLQRIIEGYERALRSQIPG